MKRAISPLWQGHLRHLGEWRNRFVRQRITGAAGVRRERARGVNDGKWRNGLQCFNSVCTNERREG